MSTISAAAQSEAAGRDRSARLTIILFLCAFAMGAWEFGWAGNFGFGRGYEMAATARSLVHDGVFGNPFEPWITGPTAANPPAYPFLLAGLLRIFSPSAFVLVVVLLNILLNAAIALMLPRLSEVLYGARLPGVFAALLWIAGMRLMTQWDTTLTVAALLTFILLTERSASSVFAGVLGALLTLLNPATVFVFVPWLAFLVLTRRRLLRYAAVVLGIAPPATSPGSAAITGSFMRPCSGPTSAIPSTVPTTTAPRPASPRAVSEIVSAECILPGAPSKPGSWAPSAS